LHALVEDNVAALRPSFRLVPWTLEVDIPEGIRCDSYPGPLGQVVANMIQNAAAHAFGGRSEGSLKIAAQCTSGIVNLSFTDDGTGMSAAVLARIFEPIYTTRLGQGGSGLGLSISMNIVKNVLGGDLQVRSQEGAGTCFTLTFPQVAPIHQPDTPPPH
jgi:signal transduction histidine kinase